MTLYIIDLTRIQCDKEPWLSMSYILHAMRYRKIVYMNNNNRTRKCWGPNTSVWVQSNLMRWVKSRRDMRGYNCEGIGRRGVIILYIALPT